MKSLKKKSFYIIPLVLVILLCFTTPVMAAVDQIILTESTLFTAEKGYYTESLQAVLTEQNSALSDYSETLSSGSTSAAEIIWLGSQSKDYGFNPKVILVTLKVLGWLDQEPTELLTPFVQEMRDSLWEGYSEYLDGTTTLTLKDGTSVEITNSNSATYALAYYLAPNLESEDALETMLSQWKTDYEEIFGDDPSEEEAVAHSTTSITPFLQLPFAQSSSSFIAVNSFFDHASPGTYDDSILRFDGKTVSTASFSTCTLGVSCYGGHNGIDYKTGSGLPIYAAADGTVVYRYYNTNSSAGTVDSGLYIDHDNGYRTAYWHMDPISVAYGDTVKAGDLVGYSGNIGQSSGAHLHFGLRLVDSSKSVDPYGWWSTSVTDTWGDSTWMWAGDQIADMGEAQTQLFYRSYWTRESTGYGGSSFWTYSVSSSSAITNWGIWGTYLSTAGTYKVYAYWPSDSDNTTNAKYKIFYGSSMDTVAVDQSATGDTFVLLGSYTYPKGPAAVILTDNTGTTGDLVQFNSVKWVSGSSTVSTNTPTATATKTATPTKTPTPSKTSTPTKTTTGATVATSTKTPTKTPTSSTGTVDSTDSGSDQVNLAEGMTATQSSVYKDRPVLGQPGLAIDGNTNGVYSNSSVTHTKYESQPWWQVDLGSVQSISNITLWNRTDCCSTRLASFYVFVSDNPFTSTKLSTTKSQSGVSSFYFSGKAGTTTNFEINRTGRYIRIQLSGTNYLSLAEVQVWSADASVESTATPTPSPTPTSTATTNDDGLINVAQGMTATQAGVFKDRPVLGQPGLAIDGNTDGNYSNGSVSHTKSDSQPWWQVDLGYIQNISSVTIWNRTDCCGSRLAKFYVFVSDVPFTSTTLSTTKSQSGVSSYYFSGTVGTSTDIDINRTGRYVRIQLSGTNYLSLAEVQIWSDGVEVVFTPTPTPTTMASTPDPDDLYAVQSGYPYYIPNFAHPSDGDDWLGVGGQVFNSSGIPVNNIVVVVKGTVNGVAFEDSTRTGANTDYGAGGFEIVLADAPLASSDKLSITLYSLSGTALSNTVYFDTNNDVLQNLILINFKTK